MKRTTLLIMSIFSWLLCFEAIGQYQLTSVVDTHSTKKNLFHFPCDIDADGDIDVFSVYCDLRTGFDNDIELAINDGTGQFELLDYGRYFIDPMIVTNIHEIRDIRLVDLGNGGLREVAIWINEDLYPYLYVPYEEQLSYFGFLPLNPLTEQELGYKFLHDIDSDGDLDVAITNEEGQPLWSISNGVPLWDDLTIPRSEQLYFETKDVDGDGVLDMLEYDHLTQQLVFRKKLGEGNFGPLMILLSDVNFTGRLHWILKDMNGDGLEDFIGSSNDGKVYFAQRLSFLEFGVVSFWTQNLPLHNFYMANILPTDYNSDGLLDIVLATAAGNNGMLSVLFNNDNGGFSEPTFISGGWLRDFIVADFNGNGELDVLNVADPRALGKAFTVQLDFESDLNGTFDAYGKYLPGPILMDDDLDGHIDLVCEDLAHETDRRFIFSDFLNNTQQPVISSNISYHYSVDFAANLLNEYIIQSDSTGISYGYLDESNEFHFLASNLGFHLISEATHRTDLDGDGLEDDYYEFRWNSDLYGNELNTWVHSGAEDYIQNTVVFPNFEDIGISPLMIVRHQYKIIDGDNDGLMEYYYLDANMVTKRIEMTVNGTWGEATIFEEQHVDVVYAALDEITGESFVVGYVLEESWCGDYVYTGEIGLYKMSDSGEVQESLEWVANTDNPCDIHFGALVLDLDADGKNELCFQSEMEGELYTYHGLTIANGQAIVKSMEIAPIMDSYGNVLSINGIFDLSGNVIQEFTFTPLNTGSFSDYIRNGFSIMHTTFGYGCTDPTACNYDGSLQHMASLCCYGTCGCTDETAINYNEEATCDNGSCQIGVTGRVFHDVNSNGVLDVGDYGLAYQTVTTDDGASTYITNEEGYFSATTGNDNVLLTHVADANFPFYTTAHYYQTNLINGLNVEFGLSSVEPLSAVDVQIYHDWYLCDDDITFYVSYRNRGNTILNGQVEFIYDTLITGHTAISPISSQTGTTLTFDFENLMPGQMQMKQVSLHTPDFTFMSEMMDFSATVNGFVDNVLAAWGTNELQREHGCSYDPNDIQATPEGYTESHFIEDGTAIEYLVRFQNTGNAPALNVRIDNIIDENLDLSSFQFIANSHDVSVAINHETREIQFFFDEIMLPDSAQNEPQSHGFISYRIAIAQQLETGLEIHNTASIYFDNNPAVVTNTTLHTIYNCEDFAIDILVDESEWCSAQTVEMNAVVPWADAYMWLVNGQLASQTTELQVFEAGEKQITFMADNPLCGLFEESLTLNLYDVQTQSITASATSICEGESVELAATYTGNTYAWSINGELLSTDAGIEVTTSGAYELTTTMGACVQSNTMDISVTPLPEANITQSINVLSTLANANWTYQWYFNDELIIGATASTYEITASGMYQVVVMNGSCEQSSVINATYLGVEENGDASWSWYPNPVVDELTLTCATDQIDQELEVVDVMGRVVYAIRITQAQLHMDTSNWSSGVYTLRINNGAAIGQVIKN